MTWSLDPASIDREDFEIDSSTGVLTFKTPPDFEAPGDTDTRNTYNVTIQAADDKSGAPDEDGREDPVTLTLEVTVTDVEEAGVVTLTTLQPQEGVEISATLMDPDGKPRTGPLTTAVLEADKDLTDVTVTTMWQWARSARGTGPWTDIEEDDESTTDVDESATAKTNAYTPTKADVGMYLRATATYEDGHCRPCEPEEDGPRHLSQPGSGGPQQPISQIPG